MGHNIVLKLADIPDSTFRVFAGNDGKSLQITIDEQAIQLNKTAVLELNARLREEFATSINPNTDPAPYIAKLLVENPGTLIVVKGLLRKLGFVI